MTMGSGHSPPRSHLVDSSTCTLHQMPHPHSQARVVAGSETVTKVILESRGLQKTEYMQLSLQRERVSSLSNPSDSAVLRGNKQRVDAECNQAGREVALADGAEGGKRGPRHARPARPARRRHGADVRARCGQSTEGRAVPLQDVSFDPCFVAYQVRGRHWKR